MNEYIVETEALTKRFGERVAVDGVDLRIPRGSAFGYLGPNGAGKTTLIRMLLGLTSATSGSMRLLGRPVPEQRAAPTRSGESTARSSGSASPRAPTSASRSTRSGCGSGSESPARCSETPSS